MSISQFCRSRSAKGHQGAKQGHHTDAEHRRHQQGVMVRLDLQAGPLLNRRVLHCRFRSGHPAEHTHCLVLLRSNSLNHRAFTPQCRQISGLPAFVPRSVVAVVKGCLHDGVLWTPDIQRMMEGLGRVAPAQDWLHLQWDPRSSHDETSHG